VSIEDFLNTMAPHFAKATCLKDNTLFDITNTTQELLEHLKTLEKNNVADDILFTK
jgi:hypothetical protein